MKVLKGIIYERTKVDGVDAMAMYVDGTGSTTCMLFVLGRNPSCTLCRKGFETSRNWLAHTLYDCADGRDAMICIDHIERYYKWKTAEMGSYHAVGRKYVNVKRILNADSPGKMEPVCLAYTSRDDSHMFNVIGADGRLLLDVDCDDREVCREVEEEIKRRSRSGIYGSAYVMFYEFGLRDGFAYVGGSVEYAFRQGDRIVSRFEYYPDRERKCSIYD